MSILSNIIAIRFPDGATEARADGSVIWFTHKGFIKKSFNYFKEYGHCDILSVSNEMVFINPVNNQSNELPALPVQQEAVPQWYSEDEIYGWLKHKNYSHEIANELAGYWFRDLQGAFKKGWEKASNPAGTADSRTYKYMDAPVPVQQGYSEEHLRTEFENNPPCEFAAENYWEVYAGWLEGKFSGDGWISVDEKLPDESGYYFIHTTAGTDKVWFNKDKQYWGTNKAFQWLPNYWQPLPLPPKTK